MKSLYSHLKQPVSREFPNDIWIGVMIDVTGNFNSSNMKKVKESDHLSSVMKWSKAEIRSTQLINSELF